MKSRRFMGFLQLRTPHAKVRRPEPEPKNWKWKTVRLRDNMMAERFICAATMFDGGKCTRLRENSSRERIRAKLESDSAWTVRRTALEVKHRSGTVGGP
jgi:hypothetical protein